jgi:hypothetical protein
VPARGITQIGCHTAKEGGTSLRGYDAGYYVGQEPGPRTSGFDFGLEYIGEHRNGFLGAGIELEASS